MGLPGSGKSTLANLLAGTTGLPIVSRDTLRAQKFPRLGYGDADKAQVNLAVFEATAARLRAGESCIVDGMTFAGRAQREQLRQAVQDGGAGLLWIYLDCPPALAAQRIAAQKNHPAADRGAALAEEVARRFEPVGADALVLDAAEPPPALLHKARARLMAAPLNAQDDGFTCR